MQPQGKTSISLGLENMMGMRDLIVIPWTMEKSAEPLRWDDLMVRRDREDCAVRHFLPQVTGAQLTNDVFWCMITDYLLLSNVTILEGRNKTKIGFSSSAYLHSSIECSSACVLGILTNEITDYMCSSSYELCGNVSVEIFLY